MNIRFEQPHQPFGRINVYVGEVKCGVIMRTHTERNQSIFDWTRYGFGDLEAIRGRTGTERSAKNAITDALGDYFARMGLIEAPKVKLDKENKSIPLKKTARGWKPAYGTANYGNYKE